MGIVVVAVGCYLLGSIPFGYLFGRLKGRDIRREGSNNIGATNLWRVCGWKLGLSAFIIDFGKGLAAVLTLGATPATGLPQPYQAILAAVAAVLGHNYPVWLRFKGGKGVATSAGAVAGLMWLPFAVAITVFILVVAVFHYISLGSMVASVALVAACRIFLPDALGADLPLLVMSALLSVLLIIRHRTNVRRILDRTENRFPPPKRG